MGALTMALRQRLETVTELLCRLEAGRFMYGLECLHEGAAFIPNCVRHLLQSPSSGREGIQAPLGQDQFLTALFRVKMALWRLRPGRLCRLLDEVLERLEDVGEDSSSAWLFATLAHVQSQLQVLAPAQALSHLQHLAQLIQHMRPAGGFQPQSYHPDLVARLDHLHFLPVLDTLHDVIHDLPSPTNIQQLHLLHHFLLEPQAAPAA